MLAIYSLGVPLLMGTHSETSWAVNRRPEGWGCFGVWIRDCEETNTKPATLTLEQVPVAKLR